MQTQVQALPSSFGLRQNYPNPFNPSTTIVYDLPVRSQVRVTVYDVMGREVSELFNGMREAGSYSHVWNATNLATGMYFLRLQAGQFTTMRSMLLIK